MDVQDQRTIQIGLSQLIVFILWQKNKNLHKFQNDVNRTLFEKVLTKWLQKLNIEMLYL
jgi:hypothetical protein